MATFDWKKLSTTDKVIAVTAAVALIALFLPWEGYSGVFGSYTKSGLSSSWGLIGGLLIVLAGVYIVFLRAGSNMPKFSYGPGVIVLGLSVIGAVLVILRWATLPRVSFQGTSYSYGPQVGIYLTLIAGIVQAFFALRMFRASGEALPWSK